MADNAAVTTDVVHVQGTWAEEEAKLNSQQVQIITKKEIEKKQTEGVHHAKRKRVAAKPRRRTSGVRRTTAHTIKRTVRTRKVSTNKKKTTKK